jgi:hypothetical protein
MSFVKHSSIERILEVKQSAQRIAYRYDQEPGDRLSKFAAISTKDMKDDDGFLYVRCRAISSRVNKNNDGWPSEELMKAHETFIGRPVFVDHNNDDPKRTRGVIVDATCNVEDDDKISKLDPYYSTAPDNHKPPTWIELLIEVDAKTFPRLAKSVRDGDIDSVSMGANIEKSICSVCAHEAATPNEYCDHIKKKGITFEIVADNGEKVRKKAYEDCYGVNFFEISFVFDPADTTALISEKVGKTGNVKTSEGLPPGALMWADDAFFALHPHEPEEAVQTHIQNGDITSALGEARKLSEQPQVSGQQNQYYGVDPQEIVATIQQKLHSSKTAANPVDFFVEPVGTQHDQDDPNYIPQSEMITAPQQVNTLREEHRCPVCRAADMISDPDGIERCPTCGHIQEPEPLNNPDLGVARDTDLRQDVTDTTDPQGNPQVPVNDGSEQVEIAPVSPVTPVARNLGTTSAGINDMEDLFETTKVETTLGGPHGIHRGTINGLSGVATVKVTFPTIETDNSLVVPQDNPIFGYFLAAEAASKLRCALDEVPIIVEKVGDGDLSRAVEIIRTNAATHPRVAATTKKTILNQGAKPSDEPKGEKIVSDELKPREASDGGVTVKTVEVGGQSYKLVPVDEPEKDDEDEKDEKTAEEIEETGDTVPVEEEQEGQPQEEEQTPVEVASEDKEAKLLVAMQIADEAIELGLIDKKAKMVYIAQLEDKAADTLESVQDVLALVKSAGLGKRGPVDRKIAALSGSSTGVVRVPRLAHSPFPNGNGNDNLSSDPDFLWGV